MGATVLRAYGTRDSCNPARDVWLTVKHVQFENFCDFESAVSFQAYSTELFEGSTSKPMNFTWVLESDFGEHASRTNKAMTFLEQNNRRVVEVESSAMRFKS